MTLRRSLPLAVLAAAALSLGQARPGIPSVAVAPVAESDAVRAGSTVRLALVVTVPPGLHLQSDRPRDPALIPTRLSIDSAQNVSFVDVAFPPSTDFRVAGYDQPLAVFENEFVVGARLALAKDLAPGSITLPAHFRYQACNATTCFAPRTVETQWVLKVGAGGSASRQHADVFNRIDWGRAQAAPLSTPPAPTPPTASAAPPADGDVLTQFDRFTILGTTGYSSAPEFVQFIKDAEAGVKQKGLLEGQGPLAVLLIVFLGGLALNLTPCVLPMIPINLAIIGAGARSSRRGRGFLLGSAYGAAMALVYGVIGLIVILSAGTFGTINSSPWFNIGIALLFVFLGLAMFDVVSLDFSRYSSRIRFDEKNRGTFVLAFGMGAVAALLAGACVAPVVVQVVVFASNLYAGGTAIALALPFVLGLGMALPWPLAGAGLSALPKPGAWMVRVKQAMGVFIMATAVYYGYVAYEIFANRWVDPETVKASVAEQLKAGWHPSLAEGLQVAERDRTLVLVDFWASWCKNCLVMDTTTLRAPDVVRALEGYTRIKFQAENPDDSPAKELMQRIGAVGLPVYVILRPKTAAPPGAR